MIKVKILYDNPWRESNISKQNYSHRYESDNFEKYVWRNEQFYGEFHKESGSG